MGNKSSKYGTDMTDSNSIGVGRYLNEERVAMNTERFSTLLSPSPVSIISRTINWDINRLPRSQPLAIIKEEDIDQEKDRIDVLKNSGTGSFILNYCRKNLTEFPIMNLISLSRNEKISLLDISNNRLKSIPEQVFSTLRNIKRLAAGNNLLEILPDSLWSLKDLTWLDVTHNNLVSISENIGQLSNLEGLGMSDCMLSSLPSNIGNCKSLVKLGLYGNRLTTIPKEIGELYLLSKLDLSNNMLTELPNEIGQLTRLIWLNLSRNLLEKIPDSINHLVSLQELGLGQNRLKELPNLGSLRKLTILPLQNNRLTSIGAWIENLESLKKLDLSNNQLIELPFKQIFSLKYLSYLNIRHNQLSKLNLDYDQELPPLEIFDCNNNNLSHSLPFALKQLSTLKEFLWVNNPWQEKQEQDILKYSNISILSLKNMCFRVLALSDNKFSRLVSGDKSSDLIYHISLTSRLKAMKKESSIGLEIPENCSGMVKYQFIACPTCKGPFHPSDSPDNIFPSCSVVSFLPHTKLDSTLESNDNIELIWLPMSIWYCSSRCAFRKPNTNS